jgi:CheY-like chemotaxis protein
MASVETGVTFASTIRRRDAIENCCATPMSIPNTLLVVEPHENLRDAYASVLRYAGYRVEEASCPISARERLLAARPKLVLLNIHLPTTEEAIRLLRRARMDRALEGTTWIALCEGGAGLNGAQQAGFDAVLRTPVSYNDLVGAAAAFTGAPGPVRPDLLGQPCLS